MIQKWIPRFQETVFRNKENFQNDGVVQCQKTATGVIENFEKKSKRKKVSHKNSNLKNNLQDRKNVGVMQGRYFQYLLQTWLGVEGNKSTEMKRIAGPAVSMSERLLNMDTDAAQHVLFSHS